jgi:mono/diheme cytochrome c family protein
MTRILRRLGIGLAAALALGGAALGAGRVAAADTASVSKADPKNADQVALGRKVYGQYCASCHGAHLEGQPDWHQRRPDGFNPAPPHDFHGHTWRHPDDDLFGMVKRGYAAYAPPGYKTEMAAFGGMLSDAEIWAVLAFIKSSWPPEFQTYQKRITEGAVPHGGRLTPMQMDRMNMGQ